MWIICMVIGGLVILLFLLSIWLKRQEKKQNEMESAYHKWKIFSGRDPTYDEHGKLRN